MLGNTTKIMIGSIVVCNYSLCVVLEIHNSIAIPYTVYQLGNINAKNLKMSAEYELCSNEVSKDNLARYKNCISTGLHVTESAVDIVRRRLGLES